MSSFYVFLFLALLGTGVGLFPVPEDIIVLSAGVGVEQEVGNLFIIFAIVFAGILISDVLIFLAGKKIGAKIFEFKFFSFFINKNKVDLVHKIFQGHQKKIVFLGRFTSGFRPIVFFVAGMSDTKLKYFIVSDFLANLIYTPLFMFLGYRFSYDISRLIAGIKGIYHFIEIAIILSIVGWLLFSFSKRIFRNNNGVVK
ncbi:DedA family protein [Patescibacteria group bacterium]|nr:DedA family protein [Patescibacteria group bacterium]